MQLPIPFRGNRDFWNADPFRRIDQLQRQADWLFDSFQNESALPSAWGQDTFLPPCDVEETADHFIMSLDIPGMKKNDIKIELRNNVLTVSGERKEEKEEKKKGLFRSERFYGSFARSYALPEGVEADQIATEYSDG